MSWRKVLTLTYNYCKTIEIDFYDFDQNWNVQDFFLSSRSNKWHMEPTKKQSKYFHPIFLFFEGFLFMFFSRQYGECPVGWWTMWGWWVDRKRFICHWKEHEGITLRRWLFLFITDRNIILSRLVSALWGGSLSKTG